MKIIVRNHETKQFIAEYDYEDILDMCEGDIIMADDYIRLLRNHKVHVNKYDEEWSIIEQK